MTPHRRVALHALLLLGLVVPAICLVVYVGSVGVRPESSLLTAVGFSASFFVARLLTTRLPQGDEVSVTLIVGLYALAVLDVRYLIAASAAAGLLDVVSRSSQASRAASAAQAMEAVRGAAVLGLMSPWQVVLWPLVRDGVSNDAVIGWVLVAGVSYAALDILTVATQQWISGGLPVLRGSAMLLRPLGIVYLVHLAIAAVAVRLSSIPGAWTFPAALLLTLILQNSFNLYLRIRRAYAETISALAHAAELDRPHDSGHARRVADLSVAVGRRMGLAGRDLEHIGYAALLHDIGRIGDFGDDQSAVHLQRGAEIVRAIPFLAEVAPLIDGRSSAGGGAQSTGWAIVRTCSRYDRLRAEFGAAEALSALAQCEDQDMRISAVVVESLQEIVQSQYSGVGAPR